MLKNKNVTNVLSGLYFAFKALKIKNQSNEMQTLLEFLPKLDVLTSVRPIITNLWLARL